MTDAERLTAAKAEYTKQLKQIGNVSFSIWLLNRAESAEARAVKAEQAFNNTLADLKATMQERDEWKRRFALNEHVAADLRNIRALIKAPAELNTFDAVGAVMQQRDELRRQLEQAQKDIAEYRSEVERLTRKVITTPAYIQDALNSGNGVYRP